MRTSVPVDSGNARELCLTRMFSQRLQITMSLMGQYRARVSPGPNTRFIYCKKSRTWQGRKRNLGLSLRQKGFSYALAQISFCSPAMSDVFCNTNTKDQIMCLQTILSVSIIAKKSRTLQARKENFEREHTRSPCAIFERLVGSIRNYFNFFACRYINI